MIALAAILWLIPTQKIVERHRAFKSAKQPHSHPR